ncbi:PREDICTED: transcription factor bHLH30-like [Ipomoea nil]|uniref:transcription factor bHLH30-like n=1 Tax=Ipomoea nil TaxID=35883 RepID=UPI000900DDA1|nr:PREDICTED: transcription factor bHLH30-like [Ipomoea nil]XP_019165063.1 PREDICTED: transcription factor bHLH30-like [Ipomoea nil]XP_019165064.1 PREDICTED: transcription factor bHLH30-like [Ipomoea nil]
MQPQSSTDAYTGGAGMSSPIFPWSFTPVQPYNPVHYSGRDHDPFLLPPAPSPYGGFFSRKQSLPFAYDDAPPSDHLRLISDTLLGQVVHPGSGGPFGLQAELQKLAAQEIMDAKALAASKSHSEAERRRRERINNHLAKLRSLLPNTTKTDKASLLAEVIQHVKELKRQTSVIAETTPVPTVTDELTVDNVSGEVGNNKLLIRATLCCDDRSDLLPDLIKSLKGLRLKALRAEITTLGGRMRNVLFITRENDRGGGGDCDGDDESLQSISSVEDALRAVMERSNGGEDQSGSVKRQRTNNINIFQQHHK